MKPALPARYANLPPRPLQQGTYGQLTKVWRTQHRSAGAFQALPKAAAAESGPTSVAAAAALPQQESARQAKKEALAPKSVPGLGTYAAKVKAAGLDPTAEAVDFMLNHPVFASALDELGLLDEDFKPSPDAYKEEP